MDSITKSTFDALVRYRGWPCVSVYLPTHPGGLEGQAGRVRLKNLVADAGQRLVARGIRPVEARDLLAAASELVQNEAFWENQTEGLAVFASPEATRTFYLPLAVPEIAVVNSRPHVIPLLPLVDEATDYYIIAISENRARLLRADRCRANEVAVPNLPASAKQALHYDHPTDTRQFHTAVLGPGMSKLGAYHGSGDFFEHEKSDLFEYFRIVDQALHPLLRGQRAPLVFAGVGYLFPIFQRASTYSHLADAHVHGNPDGWSDRELREKTWACVATEFARPAEAALARYTRLAGDGLTSDDLRTILDAAHDGHLETLFVDPQQPVWGKWDTTHRRLRLDAQRRDDSDDLLDLSVVETLSHKGAVYSVPGTALSPGKHCQAIFRYKLPLSNP